MLWKIHFWKHKANSSASLDVPVKHNGLVVLCIVFQFECLSSQFLWIILSLMFSLAVRCHCYLYAGYCFYLHSTLNSVGDKCAVVFLCVTKHWSSQSTNSLFLMNSGQRALLAVQAWISEWSFNLCKCLSFLLELRNQGGDILKRLCD